MSDLIYPNLFLFLYDLRESVRDDLEKLTQNQNNFAAKFPSELRPSLFERDNIAESEYLELLPQQIATFPESDKPIEGYYYPVRLNDTYGLLIACSPPEDNTSYPVEYITKLKAKIDQKINGQTATLGQTWLVFAQLANPKNNPEDIAKKCCQALELGLNWEQNLQGQGRMHGGTLFELWRYQLLMDKPEQKHAPAPTLSEVQKSQHLLISFYPDTITASQAADFNSDWLRLFHYRHKILWAYGQSRYLKQKLKQNLTKIKAYGEGIKNEDLKQLRRIVTEAHNTFSYHTIELSNLGDQIRTIEINLLNYNRRLTIIQKRLLKFQAQPPQEFLKNLLPEEAFSWLLLTANNLNVNHTQQSAFLSILLGSWKNFYDLSFLEKFSNDVTNKYQLQLQKDYENLSPSLELLEELIESIQAITQIDEARRDRTLQNTVAILGVGVGAGTVVASISGQLPEATKPTKASQYPVGSLLHKLKVPEPMLVPVSSFVVTLSVSIVAAGLTALIIQLSWLLKKPGR